MRVAVLALIVAACGDNQIPNDPLYVAASGSRLKLQWYLYQDGTKALETAAFYDAIFHERCTRTEWIDGVTRCTPIADPTVFIDSECMMEVGRASTAEEPEFFLGSDRVGDKSLAVRLHRAGALRDVPAQFYERRDDVCTRIPEPTTFQYFELGIGLDPNGLQEVWPDEIVDERLGLQILASTEGLAAPIGFRDHALEVDCRPEKLLDGSTACVPTSGVVAEHFTDWRCESPVVAASEPPRAVVVNDRYGCPSYHGAGDELPAKTMLFRRTGTTCERVPSQRAYRVGAPLDLARVERVAERHERRRLQRITVRTGELLTVDDRLFDHSTRSECESYGNGELAICVPANTLAGARLFANAQCTLEVFIADVPAVQCITSTFAVVDDKSIHLIDRAYTGALFTADLAGNCRPRTTPVGHVPHVLGPPVPLETFVGGVVFSER
jgi:hypothetical protein